MKGKMKYLVFLLFLYLILPFSVYASDIEYVTFTSEIKVNKNRVLNVEENYEIYFINDVDSINRKLKKQFNIIRKDNKSINQIAKIDNIIGKNITVSDANKYKNILIKTNNQDSLVDKIVDYKLNYDYNLGRDKSRKYDEIYINIINDLEAPVSSLAFEFTFPKSLEDYNVNFILNEKILDNDEITYLIEDNKLTGYSNIIFDKDSDFSVRVELPNGYFIGTTDNFNHFYYLIIIVPLITLITILVFWFNYGKGTKFKSKYTYYPPKDYDPAEIGYLYKGRTEEVDLTSLLIHLANKGFIRFEELDDGYKLGRENTFRIIKIKDYDGKNAAQKILFDGLFKESNICELSSIEYNYFNRFMDSKKTLDNKKNRKKMFNLEINKIKITSVIILFISISFITFIPFKLFVDNIFLSVLLVIVFSIGLFVIFALYTKKFLKFVFGLLPTLLGLYAAIIPIVDQTGYLIVTVSGILIIIISFIFYSKLSIRTIYGNKMYSDIYGFRISLLTITNKKLKELIKENENYFYDMCPYAYVLGILDEWFNKGKGIITNAPNWHICQYDFDLRKENKFIKNILFTTTQLMLKKTNSLTGVHIDFKQDIIQSKLND